MAINEKALNKGHLRKLNAMRKSMTKSIGEELGVPAANDAFEKWLAAQPKPEDKAPKTDIHAQVIASTLSALIDKNQIKIPQRGYKITGKRKGSAKGNRVVVTPITKAKK